MSTTTDVVNSFVKAPAAAIHRYHLPPGVQVSQVVVAEGYVWLVGYESACKPSCSNLFRLDPRTGNVGRIVADPAARPDSW